MADPDAPPPAGAPAVSPFSAVPLDFVPAVVAGMGVGALVLWVIARLRTAGAPDPLLAHLVPWARPMAHSDERDQFLYHAGIIVTAIGGFAGAWIYGRFMRAAPTSRPAPRAAKPPDRKATRAAGGVRASHHPVVAHVSGPPAALMWWVHVLLHLLVVMGVVCLLYVPDYRSMAGSFLNAERFHHWHFFAVMPTYAYLTGLVPVLDSYSQYGVGLPVIVGNLCRLMGDFSHGSVVWLGMTYGVLYFIALYALMWAWFRNWWWSAAGLALAVLLQQFCGLDPPSVLWQYPSSTVLRSPLDVWMLLLLTGHAYRRAWTYLLLAGLVTSLAIFWESDTGIYLMGGYLAYCAFCWIDDVRTSGWDWGTAGRYLATAATVPIVFLLLTWCVVGGALFTAVFWERFLEPLLLFRSGFGMLPMPAPRWGDLHLFLTPGLYVFAAVLALVAALGLSAQHWRGGYLLGALGVYGLGVYHQYVGRSHPWNWFHVCIPFVVLATALTWVALQNVEMRLRERAQREPRAYAVLRAAQLVPVIALGTAIVLLAVAPNVRSYPGVLSGRWSIVGVDWDLPGAEFRTLDSQGARDRLAAVAARIKDEVPAQEPVAILSEFDGLLYVMTNRRPFSRFVPLYPAVALDSQADEVVNALQNEKLHYVFWDHNHDPQRWGSYLPQLLASRIAANFEVVGLVNNFEVWRRREPAPRS
jgi:hypothetical protein